MDFSFIHTEIALPGNFVPMDLSLPGAFTPPKISIKEPLLENTLEDYNAASVSRNVAFHCIR